MSSLRETEQNNHYTHNFKGYTMDLHSDHVKTSDYSYEKDHWFWRRFLPIYPMYKCRWKETDQEQQYHFYDNTETLPCNQLSYTVTRSYSTSPQPLATETYTLNNTLAPDPSNKSISMPINTETSISYEEDEKTIQVPLRIRSMQTKQIIQSKHDVAESSSSQILHISYNFSLTLPEIGDIEFTNQLRFDNTQFMRVDNTKTTQRKPPILANALKQIPMDINQDIRFKDSHFDTKENRQKVYELIHSSRNMQLTLMNFNLPCTETNLDLPLADRSDYRSHLHSFGQYVHRLSQKLVTKTQNKQLAQNAEIMYRNLCNLNNNYSECVRQYKNDSLLSFNLYHPVTKAVDYSSPSSLGDQPTTNKQFHGSSASSTAKPAQTTKTASILKRTFRNKVVPLTPSSTSTNTLPTAYSDSTSQQTVYSPSNAMPTSTTVNNKPSFPCSVEPSLPNIIEEAELENDTNLHNTTLPHTSHHTASTHNHSPHRDISITIASPSHIAKSSAIAITQPSKNAQDAQEFKDGSDQDTDKRSLTTYDGDSNDDSASNAMISPYPDKTSFTHRYSGNTGQSGGCKPSPKTLAIQYSIGTVSIFSNSHNT